MKLKNKAKWVISLLTAFTIPFSTMGTAVMAEPNEPNNQAVVTEAATDGQLNATAAETGADGPATYQEAYDRMTALKEEYPEGMTWTNFTPYGTGPDCVAPTYRWKGGPVKNSDNGVGCAAFVFILSDAAFGDWPARAKDRGNFSFDDIKVGDILRTNGGSHFVIVLQKSEAGVVVAEGNYNKSVHWGRTISKAEVMDSTFIVTRYPENFVPADDATAGQEAANGTEGDLRWTLTKGGTLTISGNGSIPDYTPSERPSWEKQSDASISTIVLTDGITGIGAYSFYESTALSVYIPSSVQTIGGSAFHNSKLINVTIPGSVTDIGNDAFHGAENLVSATVAKGVMTIGERAFQGCTSLTYMDFPASITSVGAGAFTSCKNMKSVRFMPSSEPAEIGDNVFSQCWSLMSVTLPQGATRISNGMFSSCTSLPTLYIPKSVTEIGEGAFDSCRSLTTIYFGGSETEWESLLTPYIRPTFQGKQIIYNAAFDDPFADLPDDPGDGFDKPDVPPVEPADHQHSWSTGWTSDKTSHWHQCQAADCPTTDNSQKDGYAEHSYGGWIIDVEATASQEGSQHRECTVCQYRETASIPADSGSGDDPNEPGKPSDKPNRPDSSKNLSVAKKQLKTQLAAKLKKQVKPQLKKQLKPKLKKPVSAKRKAKLKANLKTKLKKQLKAKLKPQFKQKFGKKLGNQFSKTFDTQFNSEFTKQFNAQFKKLFKQLSAKTKQAKK
ncbi:MAG: leucine-rich repeat domain-containing protein [Lachnospiraceae bacterium]|nr:leucine-rich repeat domain-containing protein [Lachnospiraceae bacterium]